MANFFEKQYKECKRNHQPLPKTAVAELARLLMLGNQHMRLKQLLSDIDIFLYFYRNNIYDTVEMIRYLKQDSFLIAKRFLNAIDCYAVDLYAEVCEELKDDHKKIVKKVVNALMSLGSLLNYCKYFNAERLVLKRLLRILVNNTEYTDDKLLSYQAWTQYKIACSHADVEEYNVAIAIHAQIIRIRETLRAKKSSEYVVEELGMSYHGIALAYAGDEQYEKAIEWYRKSIDIHSKRENPDKSDIAKSYNNIGTILIQLKRYDEAMTELEIAMELEKEYYFGVLPPDVSYTMHNMGLCYRKKNNLDMAEKWYMRSLHIKVNALGWDDPDVAISHLNLGTLNLHRKNHEKAEDHFRKCLVIHQKYYENDTTKIVMALENLAHVLAMQQRFKEGERILFTCTETSFEYR